MENNSTHDSPELISGSKMPQQSENGLHTNFQEEGEIINSEHECDLTETPESSFIDYKDDFSFEEPAPRRGRPKSAHHKKSKKHKYKNVSLFEYHQRRREAKQLENQNTTTFVFENENAKIHNGFSLWMWMEAIDPMNPNLFCVVSVSAVAGTRIRLSFHGYDPCYDFWVSINSPFIFPCGWCERNNRKLELPFEFVSFDWETHLSEDLRISAPEDLFACMKDQDISKNQFKIGMKLVAVESEFLPNFQINRIATVSDIIGDYLLISFDGGTSFSGFWAKTDSPFIHSLEDFTDELETPENYRGIFDKEKYLKSTNATVAPKSIFKTRQVIGYRQGMAVETVDNYNHDLIRQASIALVRGYKIKIHFNGWPKPYDYWLDDDSTFIYPLGHCEKYGLELLCRLPPNKYKNIPCSTSICLGYGHTNGKPDSAHICYENCPYKDHSPIKLTNRLGVSEDEKPAEIITSDCVDPLKRPRPFIAEMDSSSEITRSSYSGEFTEFVPKRKRKNQNNWKLNKEVDEKSINSNEFMKESYEERFQIEDFFEPPNFSRLKEAAKILQHDTRLQKSDVMAWDCNHVAEFISGISGCGEIVAKLFKDNLINGKSFLLMNLSDFTNILKLKLGPSLKIYHHILIFRDSNVLLNPKV